MSIFESFLEVAGNLGFLVGNNDRRRERVRKEKRSWGAEQDGFAVSIAASSLELQPDETLRIEVALRNASDNERELIVGPWLRFFTLQIVETNGAPAELSPFGQNQFEAAQNLPEHQVTLSPNQVIEADFPVSALYSLKKNTAYTIVGTASATRAVSNELTIRT